MKSPSKSASIRTQGNGLAEEEYRAMMAEMAMDSEWMRTQLEGGYMGLSMLHRPGMCKAFAPVVSGQNLIRYLSGARSQSWPYEEVPVAITLRAGFWLALSRPVYGARIVLITTVGDLPPLRSSARPIGQLLYLSRETGATYLGEVVDDFLTPLVDDDFSPLPVEGLEFVGRVLCAR
ncbi:TPA: hypothetical protein ACRL4E_001934 [Pseudomonas aeruginosa]|uniref:hypothetical protein n=1 Tax=Pseudomonas nitroreducens TaxID=46680 RepID=UPI002F35BFEA